MKNSRLYIAMLSVTLLVSSCKTWLDVMYKDYDLCRDFENYHNDDWTRNFYVVDSIPYDTINYQIIYNKGAGLQYFYVSKDYLSGHEKFDDYTLLKANFPIMQWALSGYRYIEHWEKRRKDEYPADILNYYYGTTNDPNWQTCHLSIPPTYFRVYMVRGDCFNFRARIALDSNRRPYHFPDMRANYRVVVPVWSDKPFVPK